MIFSFLTLEHTFIFYKRNDKEIKKNICNFFNYMSQSTTHPNPFYYFEFVIKDKKMPPGRVSFPAI